MLRPQKTNYHSLFPEHTHMQHTHQTQTLSDAARQTDIVYTSDKDTDKHILTWADTHTLSPVNSLDVLKAGQYLTTVFYQ